MTHHCKGLGSKFQILWKASDKTWASYCEVAHLNALNRYCELMGIGNTSELPSNYVKTTSSETEENEDNIQAHMCMILGPDKRREESKENNFSSHLNLYSTIYEMCSTISINKLKACLSYEHCLNSSQVGITPPDGPPPSCWNNYLIEQRSLDGSLMFNSQTILQSKIPESPGLCSNL